MWDVMEERGRIPSSWEESGQSGRNRISGESFGEEFSDGFLDKLKIMIHVSLTILKKVDSITFSSNNSGCVEKFCVPIPLCLPFQSRFLFPKIFLLLK